MDSIGLIGLVAGLWFALSSPGEQRRSATAWLGWLLAGTSTVMLLAGTLTEPLSPQGDAPVSTDWTTDQTQYPTEQGGLGGSGGVPIGTPGTVGEACTLSCG